MYILAVIGLLTTVISAFYYIRVIKIIYFDKFNASFEQIKKVSITGTIFVSCILLITFFLYPSILTNMVSIAFTNQWNLI